MQVFIFYLCSNHVQDIDKLSMECGFSWLNLCFPNDACLTKTETTQTFLTHHTQTFETFSLNIFQQI